MVWEEARHLLIVGCGSVVSWKYMRFIKEYVDEGVIHWYSIVDIVSQKEHIEEKIGDLLVKPMHRFYLDDTNLGVDPSCIGEFDTIIKELQWKYATLKVFVATDPRYHEWYMHYCLIHDIDFLVEKPVMTPMQAWKFAPELYHDKIENLLALAAAKTWNFSVMSGARYHEIFNTDILDVIWSKMEHFVIPITSFHIRTSSWVWNLYNEFQEREDHPYKYGFGVLNHGAYHYIDVLAQCLEFNKRVCDEELSLTLTSFAAHPSDQSARIPRSAYQSFEWQFDDDFYNTDTLQWFGETDVVSILCLKNWQGKVITLWTIAFEHTTPCCRNRAQLDYTIYNKNGRLPCTDIEIQLSTLFSVHAHMLKKPENFLQSYAEVLYRSNKEILQDEYHYYKKVYPAFESKGKFTLIKRWLEWKETKSTLVQHELTMRVLEYLSLSVGSPGVWFTFVV